MFLWEDRNNIVVLVEVEGKKLNEHELFQDYLENFIEKGSINCELAGDDLEDDYETLNFKVAENDFYSWKVKGLEKFCYHFKRKGFEVNYSHGILTWTKNMFTSQQERELIIVNFEEDAEDKGFLNPYFDDRYSVVLSNEGIAFIETEKNERFMSSFETIREAANECIAWYEAGKPCQAIELLSTAMIAERFGKQRQNVHKYFKDGKLPAPFAFADNTPYWHNKQLKDIGRVFKIDIDN